MRNFVPTPGVGLIKRLEKFDIKFWKINEAYTSCIDCKTGERLNNKRVKIGEKDVKLHMVLVRKQKIGDTVKEIHINRNYMGSHGIRMLAESWLENKTRPIWYQKEYQENKQKSVPTFGSHVASNKKDSDTH